jgi:protocatechuate 3,4-dioxygenase beta subunit
VRPPHIHFDVYGANTRLVTQMYFPGEPENDDDIIFKRLDATERAAATATVLPTAGDAEADSVVLRWDIVLLAG